MLIFRIHWGNTPLKTRTLAFALELHALRTLEAQRCQAQASVEGAPRIHGLSVKDPVLIAPGFFASGTFFQVIGDNVAVCKSVMRDVVRNASPALTGLDKLFLLRNMPLPDCTDVHVRPPHESDWEYISQKGQLSIDHQHAS